MLHACVLCVNRESLIDVTIETAVSRMQTAVELGRVIRDRRTLAMKACHFSVLNLSAFKLPKDTFTFV